MSEGVRRGEEKHWFKPENMGSEAARAICDWCEGLEEAKGDRAAMRRAGSARAMVFVPAYHDLRLALEGKARCDADGLAVMAGCLAALRRSVPHSRLPRALAEKLSPIRFRRLLNVSGPDEALRALRRGLALLDETGAVLDVAAWAYALGSDALREDATRRFAFAYYGARAEGRGDSEDEAAEAADTV